MSVSKAFTALLVFCCYYSATAHGADIHVTKFSDSFDGFCNHDCSLREAVQQANTSAGPDRIILASGEYYLNIETTRQGWELYDEDENLDGDLDITDDLIIEGSPGAVITGPLYDRLFEIISGTVTLSHLVITGGWQLEFGGAIENHAALTLTHCIVTGNNAATESLQGGGGGIANWGNLRIFSSIIQANHAGADAPHRAEGGGIYNVGDLIIRDSTLRNNAASDQSQTGYGAGIFNRGTLDIRRSLIAHNWVRADGFGSAILNTTGVAKIVSSTVSDNSSGELEGAAAIANGARYFYPSGKLSLTNVTIANNTPNGLYTRGTTYIRNSIISGNYDRDTGLPQNCYREGGTYIYHDLLLGIGNNSDCWANYHWVNNETLTTLLKPLGDYGGLTLTHALRKNTLVIDASQDGQCPTTDQRGESTNVDGDGDGIATCDLGAVEYQPDI